MRLSPQQKIALEAMEGRLHIILLFVLCLFTLIVFRLWSLQFAEREKYLQLAQMNYLRTIEEPSLRGRILDRYGRSLAENVPVYDLVVNWDGVPRKARQKSIDRLPKLLGLSKEVIQDRLKTTRTNPFGDKILAEEIEFEQVVAVREAQIPGVEVRTRPIRNYPYGKTASHLVGYLGEVNEKELEKYTEYQMGDWVGKLGLERRYEFDIPVLKGKDGYRKIQVFASGLMSSEIPGGRQPSIPGKDLWTTLDLDLQRVAEQILSVSPAGAIVAMDPRSGDILAMASHPAFDPNVFVRSRRVKERAEALKNQFNLALNSGFAFGSIFKIVVATAGLEEGIITPEDTFHCQGRMEVGEGYKYCHIWWKYKYGHGNVDLLNSLMRSCNIYYYKLGQKIGYETIIRYAREVFGLIDPPKYRYQVEGQKEPFTLIGEDPDPGKNLINRLQRGPRYWYTGDTLNLAIGQGELAATPLQVTVMMAVMANGGKLPQPRLVTRITELDGTLWKEYSPGVCTQTELKASTMQPIHDALRHVVNNIRGTAYDTRIAGLDVLGKTGTAERFGIEPDAWYSCFAPGDHPEIVVTVMIPEGGHGGDEAAPMAQKLLQYYFADRLKTQISQVPSKREGG